jgi:hypothetical protein
MWVWPWPLLWAAAAAAAAQPDASAPAPADASTRAQIHAERQVLMQKFAAEEQACRQRFIVTSCLQEVQLRRRSALAPLRQRELALDDAERAQRAVANAKALQQRQELQRARAASAPPFPAAARVRDPDATASLPTRPGQFARTPAEVAAAQAQRAAQAASRAQSQQQRIQDAAEAQARVAKRLAEREASGKAAAPLPSLPGQVLPAPLTHPGAASQAGR